MMALPVVNVRALSGEDHMQMIFRAELVIEMSGNTLLNAAEGQEQIDVLVRNVHIFKKPAALPERNLLFTVRHDESSPYMQ